MKSSLAAAAILLTSAGFTQAFEITGGTVALNFAHQDENGVTANTEQVRASIGFTMGERWEFAIISHQQNYRSAGLLSEGYMLGISAVHNLTEDFSVGLFHDCNWLWGDSGFDFHAFGAEAKIELGNGVSVSGYFGQYQEGDVGSSEISIAGLRGDFALDSGLDFSVFFQEDAYETRRLQRVGVGIGYEVNAFSGLPMIIEAELSRYSSDATPDDISEIRVLATFVLGGKRPKPTGFLGNHSVTADIPL